MKFHFLNGKVAESKDFKDEKEAIEAAKKDKSVLRVQCDKTMKYVYDTTKAAAAVVALFLICALLTLATNAATVIGVPSGGKIVNSGSGSTTGVATNGLYPTAIAAATTITNLVLLNPGSFQSDGTLILQFTASGTTASTTNTAVFALSASASTIAITNSTALGVAGSASPRATFPSVTLTLNGTTPVTTNVVYSANAAPYYANGLNIYLESIAGNTGSSAITNYSVVPVQ